MEREGDEEWRMKSEELGIESLGLEDWGEEACWELVVEGFGS